MDAKSSRVIKNSIVLYVRMLFTMAVSLYTSRAVLNALGVSDFGIYNVIGGFVAMFSIINTSLTASIQRYLTFAIGEKNSEKTSAVFCSSTNILLFLSGIIFILAETVGLWFVNTEMQFPPERMVAVNVVYQTSIFMFVLNIINTSYNAVLTANENFTAYAYIEVLHTLLRLGAVLILQFIAGTDKLIVYAIMMFALTIAIRGIYMTYCKAKYEECRYRFYFDAKLCREMFAFSAWNFLGSSSAVLKTQGVNVLLNLFFGVLVNAAVGVAYQVANAVTAFVGSFTSAINPPITKAYASHDYGYMFRLAFGGARMSALLIIVFAVPIISETELLLTTWLKIVPEYAVIFTRLLLVNILIDAMSNTLITVMMSTGNIARYQCVVGGLLLMNLPVSGLLLYLGCPPYVTMIVGCMISICAFAARMVMLKRMIREFNIRGYVYNVIVKVLMVVSVSLIIPIFASFIRNGNPILPWLKLGIAGLWTVGCCLLLGLTENERRMVYEKVYGILQPIFARR